MTYQIEIGVPIPKRTAGRSGSKYPFVHMDVGDSFLADATIKVSTIRSAVGAYMKAHPGLTRFAVRETEEGVRVWRVEDAKPEAAPAKK